MYTGDFVLQPEEITHTDILLLLTGRQFRLPGGGWLILGRDERENQKLEGLYQENDMMLLMEHRPGPTAILRRATSLSADKLAGDLQTAASLVVRYGKKVTNGPQGVEVDVFFNGRKKVLVAKPLADTMDLTILT
jgi:hypothetical protein